MGGFIAQLAKTMGCLEYLMHRSGEAKKYTKPALFSVSSVFSNVGARFNQPLTHCFLMGYARPSGDYVVKQSRNKLRSYEASWC